MKILWNITNNFHAVLHTTKTFVIFVKFFNYNISFISYTIKNLINMVTISELKQSILAKDVIDAEAVGQLQELILSGNGIDKEKANFLFDIKDALLGRQNHLSWKNLFIDSISTFLLDDEVSPGEIDINEAQWLRARIQFNGKLDDIEKAMLVNLKKKSINFPEILHFKNKETLVFEKILFGMRYVTFLAVIGSMLSSIVLFALSTIQVIKALFGFEIEQAGSDNNHLITIFVSSIDEYLFAIVLLIFSIGIYELFISKIDIVNKQKDSRPNWLIISSIDDLKSSLGKVILMILIVSFFEYSLDIKYESINDLLLLGIGILLIAAALYLTHPHSKNKENSQPKLSKEVNPNRINN